MIKTTTEHLRRLTYLALVSLVCVIELCSPELSYKLHTCAHFPVVVPTCISIQNVTMPQLEVTLHDSVCSYYTEWLFAYRVSNTLHLYMYAVFAQHIVSLNFSIALLFI